MNFNEINSLVDDIVRARKNNGFTTYKTKNTNYDDNEDVIVLTEADYNKIIGLLRTFFVDICKNEEINLGMPKKFIQLIADAQDSKRVIRNIVHNDNATNLLNTIDVLEKTLNEEESKEEPEVQKTSNNILNTTVDVTKQTPIEKPNVTNKIAEEPINKVNEAVIKTSKPTDAREKAFKDIKTTETNKPKETKNAEDDNFVCKIITKNGDEPAKEYNLTKDEYAEWLKKQNDTKKNLFFDFDDMFSDDVFDIFHKHRKNNHFWF